jgi:glycosyltransferase involved in cell wall biosynthesis
MTEALVSVWMITYNHDLYIAQAIEGVLEQKTNFPFELVIGEDCSTDRTREIVLEYQKKYPDIIRVITSDRNVGAMKNGDRTSKACQGKYLALCEGDDYWIDPYKLQTQVDFLEANPDYGLVHTNFMILETGAGIIRKACRSPKMIPQDNVYEELLLCQNFIATLTAMVRRCLFMDARREIDLLSRNWPMGDYPTWLEISRRSKVRYIKDVTAVYRFLNHSASHSLDPIKQYLFRKSRFDIASYFIEKYGCSEKTKEKSKVLHYCSLLTFGFLVGDYQFALTAREFLTKSKASLPWRTQCLIPMCRNRNFFIFGKRIYAALRFLKSKLLILIYRRKDLTHGKERTVNRSFLRADKFQAGTK